MFLNTTSLQEIQAHALREKIALFKHSTVCPISAGAYGRLAKGIEEKTLTLPVYLIIVQDQKPLSNEIAEALDIKHESPQCIILERDTVKLVLNHNQITVENIQKGTDVLGEEHIVCPV